MPLRPDGRAALSTEQALVDANLALTAALPLNARLQRVVGLARDLAAAHHAVLVLRPGDAVTPLVVHTGAPDFVVAELAARPDVTEPTVQDVLGCDTLSVPLATGDQTCGTLHLADVRSGPDGDDPRPGLVALAAAAALAVELSGLRTLATRQQQQLEAVGFVGRHLLAHDDDRAVLTEVAEVLHELMDAHSVVVMVPDPEDTALLELRVVIGVKAEGLEGLRVPAEGSMGARAMASERGLLANEVSLGGRAGQFAGIEQVTGLMACPLRSTTTVGAVVVSRSDGRDFTDADLDLAHTFTSQAALCLELSAARSSAHKLALMEDRARIARDLHDHVVQRLFAAGLTMQGTAVMAQDARVRQRVEATVRQLDETIRSIRTSIFQLQEPMVALHQSVSVRNRVVALVAELGPVLGFTPELSLEGPLDTVVEPALRDELEAVLREMLTNVARHSGARSADVAVRAHQALLVVEVGDDGHGLGASPRRSGLSNLRARAENRGGFCELGSTDGGGLLVTWTVPIRGGRA